MARPTDWHNLDLPEDPTPGDHLELQSQGKTYKTFVQDIDEVRRGLKTASKDSVLAEAVGKAMDSFKENIDKLPGQLDKLHASYSKLADALLSYAHKMDMAQSEADSALSKARTLRGELKTAETRLHNASSAADRASEAKKRVHKPGSGDPPPPDSAKVRQATRDASYANGQKDAAQGQVDSLHTQLAELKTKAENAGKDHSRATDDFVRDVEAASDAGIQNKKWYEKVGDFVADHWDAIVTACKIFVAIVGLVLLFVSGGWLVALFLAAALIVLADTIKKVAQGKAGWGDLAFAVLDCIPVVGKIAMLAKAGKLLGGMKTALRVAKIEQKMSGVMKVWRAGSQLKGARKAAFAFGKLEAKSTATDFMNGGVDRVKKNWKMNLAGSAIGVGAGSAVEKGFEKAPGLLNKTPLTNWSQSEYGRISMDFAGKGSLGTQVVIGTTSGLATSIGKATFNSMVFGQSFDSNTLLTDTATGAGGKGLAYNPGLLAARPLR
ncbi:putative T7SS-secreted protein [Streptomyces sp. NPDC047117]|uniref:putative T7SS-secreted protein n=1 Tax=unclassified Streptomyces TaxID=2593676 RepID=UPI0033F39D27